MFLFSILLSCVWLLCFSSLVCACVFICLCFYIIFSAFCTCLVLCVSVLCVLLSLVLFLSLCVFLCIVSVFCAFEREKKKEKEERRHVRTPRCMYRLGPHQSHLGNEHQAQRGRRAEHYEDGYNDEGSILLFSQYKR